LTAKEIYDIKEIVISKGGLCKSYVIDFEVI